MASPAQIERCIAQDSPLLARLSALHGMATVPLDWRVEQIVEDEGQHAYRVSFVVLEDEESVALRGEFFVSHEALEDAEDPVVLFEQAIVERIRSDVREQLRHP